MELLLNLNIRNVVPSHDICRQCFLWMKEKRGRISPLLSSNCNDEVVKSVALTPLTPIDNRFLKKMV